MGRRNHGYANALITGASSGIGEALAREIAGAGIPVVLCSRREPRLQAVAASIRDAGGEAIVAPLDVAREDEAVRTLRALDERLGGLDLVIANAGAGADRSHPGYAWEGIREALHTNVCGAAATLTAALPAMIERGRGHLVGVSSFASHGALPDSAAYCAPKAALNMLLDCLRMDTDGTGVAVTTVYAGFVRTPMLDDATHPLPQLMEPDAFARRLWRRLPQRPDRVSIPQPLGAATRAFGTLPARLRAALLRRFTR